MRAFRIEEDEQTAQALLDPDNQWTEPWGGGDDPPCSKCGGSGICDGHGRVRALCPVCRGTGKPDVAPRPGVAVFEEEDALLRYMLRRDGDLHGCVVVELEGHPSRDEDFDADEGALLLHPTRIVEVRPIDPERLRAAQSGG